MNFRWVLHSVSFVTEVYIVIHQNLYIGVLQEVKGGNFV